MNITKRPVRFFNTTGPCNPYDHYMLPPEERLVGAQLKRYIRDRLYWVIHAPRQTGKTTFLQSWMRELNSGVFTEEAVCACYINIEACQGMDIENAMLTLCSALRSQAGRQNIPVPDIIANTPPGDMLNVILGSWARLVAPKSLIVLFDEVDVLQDATMISFLRQLRSGFGERGVGTFPISLALVGMRDLKDYLISAKDGASLNPGSPFNIKVDSAVLSNFTQDDIARLFAQRTAETGQQITGDALDYVYEQSKGQPWIVNSLFGRATMRVLDENSRETVGIDHIREAREQMILARETHLDALAFRIKNPTIRKLMETLMTGEVDFDLPENEGFRLCMDLGLVSIENGAAVVANPIYREILARQMTYGPQLAIPAPEFRWENPDGSLDMDTLLKEFQQFWRENSETWEEKSNYTEAFPHLLLMAFLQRVLNVGGRIDREYAAGRGRMDLYIEYKGYCYIIEIKLVHPKQAVETVRAKGLEQIAKYRDTKARLAPAYLLVFDRRPEAKDLSWDDRISWKKEGNITVLGC
jgi:hypothetical protein